MASTSTPPEMSNKRKQHKQQFLKMMRRPSMSELDESVFRVVRRNERSLHRETTSVGKLAKVQLTDQRKKMHDFSRDQKRKFSGSDSPALLQARRSIDQSSTDFTPMGSVRSHSVIGQQSARGSIPFHSQFLLSRNSLNNGLHTPKPPPQRRHSVWEELSGPKGTNRTVVIRNKLSREFNMDRRESASRPWSPSYFESSGSRRNSRIDIRRDSTENGDIDESEKKRCDLIRRMSAPTYVQPLSDRLSSEMEARLAYITGKTPRNSVTSVSLSQTDSAEVEEGNTEMNTSQSELEQQEVPTLDKPDRIPERRNSDTFQTTSIIEIAGVRQPQRRRRYSEVSMNRAATTVLPPLVEKT